MYEADHRPYCRMKAQDCAAYCKNGRCNALSSCHFKGKPCPFYKTRAQQTQEHQAAYERLVVLERFDLIEKYRSEELKKNKKKKGNRK